MGKVKHTPGPWKLDPEKAQRQQSVLGGIAVKTYSRRYDQDVALYCLRPNETFGGLEQALVDARLIAAAPDLLEALKIVRPVIAGMAAREGNPMGCAGRLLKLDAAIAKAEVSTNA